LKLFSFLILPRHHINALDEAQIELFKNAHHTIPCDVLENPRNTHARHISGNCIKVHRRHLQDVKSVSIYFYLKTFFPFQFFFREPMVPRTPPFFTNFSTQLRNYFLVKEGFGEPWFPEKKLKWIFEKKIGTRNLTKFR
jgi:hypothetical protein